MILIVRKGAHGFSKADCTTGIPKQFVDGHKGPFMDQIDILCQSPPCPLPIIETKLMVKKTVINRLFFRLNEILYMYLDQIKDGVEMIVDEILATIELYEKYSSRRKLKHNQKILELTLIKMYFFGQQAGSKAVMGYGINATTEEELNSVHELSKMDRFNAISEGKSKGLIVDCHSFDHNEWALTRDGIMYVEALLDGING